jgi:molecular chaperone HtpG
MAIEPQAQTLNFQTEVKQLLHLVTHSLYSNNEIFLRELISNASDAADRLRFEALNDDALYEGDSDLKIWVNFDLATSTIVVRDNGIGMSREEVIQNLGTIAKSGTSDFLAALTGDQAKDAHLIGQFGVGLYSVFMVSDEVEIRTRRAGMKSDQGVLWKSKGEGEYTIENIEKSARGTEIILHINKDKHEFLDYWRLSNIIKKYSDHILLPIIMQKPATEKDKSSAEEVVNKATALWTLNKKDIKDEEYIELYKHISRDFEAPLLWSHNKVEGKLEYITLLFIPAHAPFDLWMREHKSGLKLYVQRVFIMDDAEQLVPNYLRFLRGIVDSKDLPLNVSREILQNNKVIDNIKHAIVKRVLEMLEKLATDDVEKYKQFWKEFGQVIKEGVVEDFANKDKITKLLRFSSTFTGAEEQNVSLDEYVKRMQPDQEKIYYITAESFNTAKNSPHLEVFSKKNIEVLLLANRIDEWMLTHFTEYAGKQLVSVTKGDLDLGKLEDKTAKEKLETAKADFKELITKMQEILQDKIKEVQLSERLTDSPACLIADQNEMSMNLQRIMLSAGHVFPKGNPIMEINAFHPIILKLKTEVNVADFVEWTTLLYEQALLAEGGKLDNPALFVKRLNTLLLKN